ncbi:MAG: hypothetical protein LLF98_02180 [Clostridium sp.]|uniref:hypothetical protein n=1 Tax=Clostridium sp. TaxID=1506 RepID=UPI0025C412CB|nr:hypothetical protein [Clostridium sp.]MCE5220090.1 hypothetical protein [Clostridium sp.]
MIIGNAIPWSEEDLNIIREKGKDLEIDEIINLLSVKRTHKAVQHKLSKFGIHRKKKVIKNYDEIKHKYIDDVQYKLCKQCERYLPCSEDYFPTDIKGTIDGLRNVCRECKGELFRINSPIKPWTDEEINLMIINYPYYSNLEIIELFLNDRNVSSLEHKAKELGLYKTLETKNRINKDAGKLISIRKKEENKWIGSDNPFYNSQRFGELNPNYKGGISVLSLEIRRNIKQWKFDSMKNSNYKCFFTGERFDVIHHLYSLDNIIQDALSETKLPLYDSIGWYTQEELQTIIDKCLELHYRYPLGICMQNKYHVKFHLEFGYGNNTPEQFYEFIDNYNKGKYKDLKEVG